MTAFSKVSFLNINGVIMTRHINVMPHRPISPLPLRLGDRDILKGEQIR